MSKKENTNTIVLETIVPEIARNLNTIVKRVKNRFLLEPIILSEN